MKIWVTQQVLNGALEPPITNPSHSHYPSYGHCHYLPLKSRVARQGIKNLILTPSIYCILKLLQRSLLQVNPSDDNCWDSLNCSQFRARPSILTAMIVNFSCFVSLFFGSNIQCERHENLEPHFLDWPNAPTQITNYWNE